MSMREIPISVRCHTKAKQEEHHIYIPKNDLRKPYGKRVLVFDTETSIDQLQNLIFGQALIAEGTEKAHICGQIINKIIFYDEEITESDLTTIKEYARK